MKYLFFLGILFFTFLSNVFGQQPVQVITEKWNNESWMNSSRVSHTYKGKLITSSVNDSWDSSSASWRKKSKIEYERNSKYLTQKTTIYNWNGLEAAWKNASRVSYTYNEDGKLNYTTNESWIEEEWQLTSRNYSTFDSKGNLSRKYSQKWDIVTSQWINNREYRYYRSNAEDVNYYHVSIWNADINAWVTDKKVLFERNSDSELQTIIRKEWKDNSWTTLSKQQKFYIDDNGVAESISKSWESVSNSWKYKSHSTYLKNENGRTDQCLSQVWNSNSWKNSSRSTYIYPELNRNNEQLLTPSNIQFFPNPVQHKLTINVIPTGKILIVDAAGKIIMTLEKTDTEDLLIDVSEFKPGTYFIHHRDASIGRFIKF